MHYSWVYDKDFHRNHLPNDVEILKDIIVELVQETVLLRQQVAELQKQNAYLHQQVEDLKGQVALLMHKQFGQKSEKQQPSQSSPPQTSSSQKKPRQRHPGRRPLPEHLARVRIEHDLSEEEKVCSTCHEPMSKIAEVITEQLDVVPVQLQVLQHVRSQYACRKCYGCIKTASLPHQPIEKGRPTARLLAYILANKFAYHIPFYRQEHWFARQGCPITRSTMWDWEEKVAFELRPLVDCLRQEVQSRDHQFGDDTPMPTLEKGLGRTRTARMWVYTSPKTDEQPCVTVYEYTPDRKGQHPQAFLKDSKGYLQVDGYSGFKALFDAKREAALKEVSCMAHARRGFVEVVEIDPESIAQEGVDMINELYHVESVAREAGCDALKRKFLRRKRSKPITKTLYKWLMKHKGKVPPKSRLGRAMGYMLNHWTGLTRFLEDGRLEIDNNRAERAIKPLVIGRKNYLFMGGLKGGKAAADIYTLIETCHQNNVDPYIYLADILERIPTHPNKRIHELLPYNWTAFIVSTHSPPYAQAA